MRRTFLAVFVVVAAASCAVSGVPPMTVPLAYKANPKNIGVVAGLSCSTVTLKTKDAREQTTILGTRVHESKPLKADVSASGDPAAWLSQGVDSVLRVNGFTTQGGPTLLVTLDSLHTVESIWHRSSYEARLALTGELLSKSGKSCWKASVDGQASNYGYAGSIENYQEMLNTALDGATANLIQAAGFKDGLCHCGE